MYFLNLLISHEARINFMIFIILLSIMIKRILNSRIPINLAQSVKFKSNFISLLKDSIENSSKQKITNRLLTQLQQSYVSSKQYLDSEFYMQLINSECSYKQAKPLLDKIVYSRISLRQFQTVWKKYNYYMCKIFEKGLFQSKEQLFNFLDQITAINQKFNSQLKSQNLTKVYNKLTQQFLSSEIWKGLDVNQKVRIIEIVTRYNIKKAKFLFKAQRKQLYKQLSGLQQKNSQKLLFAMNKMNFFDTFILEFCIDQSYKLLNQMSSRRLINLMSNLANSHRYINKQFVIKAQKRVIQLLHNFTVQQTYCLVHLTSSFSLIQTALKTHSYFQQLDRFYQNLFGQINQHLHLLKNKQISSYASSLRRSMHFDETIIKSVIEQCFRRKIVQFEDKEAKITDSINVQNIASILHMLASFNYRDTKFINYFIGIVQLIQKNPDQYISVQHYHRVLWSICVLFNDYQIRQVFPFIEMLFRNERQINNYQSASFYYCYLLLKRQYPQLSVQNKKVQAFLNDEKNQQNNQLRVQASQIQQQIFKTMLECDIPSLMQYNLNNIICDIYVPKYQGMENLIIEVHGFHHFARNVKRVNGSTSLKQKIIQNDGYYSFYISIDEWLIAEDKTEFINNFMQLVKKQYDAKIAKKKNFQTASKINPKNGRLLKNKLKPQISINSPKSGSIQQLELTESTIKKESLKDRLNRITQNSTRLKLLQQ